MDAQKIKFMMSIQLEINKLETILGSSHQDVIVCKTLFHKLSQTEIQKKKLENTDSEFCDELIPIKLDTEAIRSHLEIRANPTIDYDFILEDRVKKQLITDNKRMGNAQLNTSLTELERFYNYCVAAFFQIEELINYYFGAKYSFKDFLKLLREKNPNKIYNQIKLSEVPIADKIYVFESLFYFKQINEYGKFIHHDSTINLIKDVRNEDSHRCNIIEQDTEQIVKKYKDLIINISSFNKKRLTPNIYYKKSQEEKNIEKQGKLINFIRDKNYNIVRDTIQELTTKIKTDLQ